MDVGIDLVDDLFNYDDWYDCVWLCKVFVSVDWFDLLVVMCSVGWLVDVDIVFDWVV